MKIKLIREDIQFLRGLSVLIIFFFHFDQINFKYFYVGVDIFFLISGYVITNSIFNNINLEKNFNLFDYFLKRLKRIYPNLLFFIIIFICLFFYFTQINDSLYIDTIISGLTTIFGVSNFYYILNPNLGYFEDTIKWLQHTWSLSVELQFYVFYGILILFIFKCRNKIEIKKILIYFLIFLSIISFYLFIFGNGKYFSSYYFGPSRFWEFFLGSLIYLTKSKKLVNTRNINFSIFITFYIIFLVLINFLPYDLNYRIIIPLFTIPIYFYLIFKKTIKLYSFNNFFKFYGNISYSFFLWHLPIISLVKLNTISTSLDFITSISITTIISYFTFKFIETPLNKKSKYDYMFKKVIKFFSFLMIILLILLLINQKLIFEIRDQLYKNIIKLHPKIVDINKNNSTEDFNDNWVLQFDSCNNKNESFSWYRGINCLVDDNNRSLFYIFGNSYGDHFVPTVYGLENKHTLYKARFENCYIDNSYCTNKLNLILNEYKNISKNFDRNYLFISLSTNKISKKKITYILEDLPKQTKVVFVYPHPSTSVFSNSSEFKNYQITKNNSLLTLKSLSDKYNLLIFDPYIYFCPNNNCNLSKYEKYFTDGEHFRLSTSKTLSKELNKLLN